MGARDDFSALRRAIHVLETSTQGWEDDYGTPPRATNAMIGIFRKASSRELEFLQLSKRPFFGEVIDLAFAVIGEERAEGPAAETVDRLDTGKGAAPSEDAQ